MNRYIIKYIEKEREYILIDTKLGYVIARHINKIILENKKDEAEWYGQCDLTPCNS